MALAGLIEDYERHRFLRRRVSDGEILGYRLEAKNSTQVEVDFPSARAVQ